MAKFTLETPIKELMANEKAVAAINSVAAGLADNAMLKELPMTLKQVAKFANGMLSDETLAKIEAALAEIE